MQLRVCVLTTSFPRTEVDPAGIFIGRSVAALAERGVVGEVIVPLDTNEPAESTYSGFRVHRYRYGLFARGRLAFGSGILPNIRRSPLLVFQVPALILMMAWCAWRQRRSFDVMHAHWLPAGLAALLCSAFTGRPFVLTVRGEDVALLTKPVIGTLLRFVLRHATAVTAVSKSFCELINSDLGITRPNCLFIPNGVEVTECTAVERENFRARYHLPADTQFIVGVGRVIPLKRFEVLVKLLGMSGMSEWHALVVGDGNEALRLELLAIAEQLGVSQRIHLIGAIPPDQVSVALSLPGIFVTASSHEGRPNALVEALALGKICCASDIPAHREVIQHEKNGFLFDPADLARVAAICSDIISAPEKFATMQARAKESVAAFTWKQCAAQYQVLYRDALAQRALRRAPTVERE